MSVVRGCEIAGGTDRGQRSCGLGSGIWGGNHASPWFYCVKWEDVTCEVRGT